MGNASDKPAGSLKVALVHDWLTGMRGGEKVLEVFCELFPQADIFTLIHVPGTVSPGIENHRIVPSALQWIPFSREKYRNLLPLMPRAIGRFDLRGYDLVLSTSHCVAKGARPAAGTPHVCYCFTPMRYIWDQFDHYFGPGRASFAVRSAMRLLRPALQKWDRDSCRRVDHFIADSGYVAGRIEEFYGRKAAVIYAHADTDFYGPDPRAPRGDFYLIVSALAPYKRLDLAVRAFNQARWPLKVIGSGQDAAALKKMALPNVEFLGWLSNEEIRDHYRRARALIFPGTEDFGIVPVEAMACGTPVVAFGEGGALETVVQEETGLFFHEPTPESLIAAVRASQSRSWDPQSIRAHALKFSKKRFIQEISEFFRSKLDISLGK